MVPVLDKGYVKQLGKSMDGLTLQGLVMNFNQGVFDPKYMDIPSLVLEIKCPLFVQLFLMDNRIVTVTKLAEGEVEAYIPTINEIGIGDLETRENIRSNLAAVTEALLLNPKAYQMDGCNRFTSQVTSPISIYTTVIAHAPLSAWVRLIEQKRLPPPIEAYRAAIHDMIHAEWAVVKPWLKVH